MRCTRSNSSTRPGMTSTISHAPAVNLLTSSMIVVAAVRTAPTPLITARVIQPRDRSVLQCLTMPTWESVNPMNTPVERVGVIGVGAHDQGADLDGERRGAAEPPFEHRARRFLDDLDLVTEMAGELLAVALAALRRDTRRRRDSHLTRLGRDLGQGHNNDHDRDDHQARHDQHGGRHRRAPRPRPRPRHIIVAAFDKGPEPPGIRTRILLKLRHVHDFSWSAAA